MWQSLVYIFALNAAITFCWTISQKHKLEHYQQELAVQRFRDYLRIDTSKEENINEAVEFWQRLADEVGLPCAVYEPAGKPIVVITWKGSDPTLPSIMLNSHMDVVPVDYNDWDYPPFGANMTVSGDIYGRGAQDTKDVAINYFEAIRKLRDENFTPERTFHITLMPDEESGGRKGMGAFVESEEFKALNVGFALDEGLASSNDTLFASYVDRRPWQMKFEVQSDAGHGYTMPDDSAMEKAYRLMDIIMGYRETQKSIMKSRQWFDFGSYSSININMLEGGLAPNVVPARFSIVVDMRLNVDAKASDVQEMISSWADEAGNGTTVTYLKQFNDSAATAVDDTNPYWVVMRNVATRMGINILPMVCPARTDLIYIRNKGIPAFGFTTKSHTISRIHGANEYLNARVLLQGIDIYAEILKELGKKNLSQKRC